MADGKPDYKIDFINDWGAHLRPLISDHAYDFSLVWFRPNCDVIDRLGDDSKLVNSAPSLFADMSAQYPR